MSQTDNPIQSLLPATGVPVVKPLSPAPSSSFSQSMRLANSIEKIKSSKILIVDDEPLLIRVVRRFLQTAGYSEFITCLLYTSPSPRDLSTSRMPSSA